MHTVFMLVVPETNQIYTQVVHMTKLKSIISLLMPNSIYIQ
jgi:hypothetical protein